MIETEDKPTRLRCSEIWGGIGNTDLDVSTGPVTTSLFSTASDSDSGGDVYYFSVCARDTIVRIALADVMGQIGVYDGFERFPGAGPNAGHEISALHLGHRIFGDLSKRQRSPFQVQRVRNRRHVALTPRGGKGER